MYRLYAFVSCLLVSICLNISCADDEINPQGKHEQYAFIVAGHVYGAPGTSNAGVHPPFKDKFEDLKKNTDLKLGVFTGDIVKDGTEQDWIDIDADIMELGIPVYFAAGNHDIIDRSLFEQRYGNTYFSFLQNGDLFIVLDGNYDGWNIAGTQLDFFKESINNNPDVNNIFIFVHQVIWWEGGNPKYTQLRLNSLENKSDVLTYWQIIHPLLVNTEKQVFLFAGDIGAANWSDNFMYGKEDNVAFIASGMGGGDGDNIVEVSVSNNQVSISVKLLHEDIELFIRPDTFMIY